VVLPLALAGGGKSLAPACGDAELARAARTDAAAAAMYWRGVGVKGFWHWRRALGVTCTNKPAAHRLMVDASARGGQTQVPFPAITRIITLRLLKTLPDEGKR
jgi:hypothetical protein